MKQGIFFDLDGTLWDSTGQIVPAWNRVLTRRGARAITAADMAGVMGMTSESIARVLIPDRPPEEAMTVLKECLAAEASWLREHGGTLYPDLEDVLRQLRESCSLYLVSNCNQDYLNAFFSYHRLGPLFEDSETHGNTGLSKAENIRLVIRRRGVDRAFYVGDTDLDRLSAEEAGIPFVFASYGFGTAKNAVRTIDRISELPAVAADLFGSWEEVFAASCP